MTENSKNQVKKLLHGGCHCGAIQFEALVDITQPLLQCNCSICSMTGFIHLFVPHQDFQLQQGLDQLTSYQFNTAQANHLFCSVCGVKSFYQPRSHPKSWSINAHCLKNFDFNMAVIKTFDGQNWEQAQAEMDQP